MENGEWGMGNGKLRNGAKRSSRTPLNINNDVSNLKWRIENGKYNK